MILREMLQTTRGYLGHMPDGSSIQQHSAGSHYPYVFAVVEKTSEGVGYAQVLDPSGAVVADMPWFLGDRVAKLHAFEQMLEAAGRFAAQRRERLS